MKRRTRHADRWPDRVLSALAWLGWHAAIRLLERLRRVRQRVDARGR